MEQTRKLRNSRFYALFSFVVLAGTLSINSVITSLQSRLIIEGTGEISTAYLTARSGSAEDIQEAVEAMEAADGGTVYVPEGEFAFNIDPNKKYNGVPVGVIVRGGTSGGINIIGSGKERTILRQTVSTLNELHFFYVDGRLRGQRIRISGLRLVGNVTDEQYNNRGIKMLGATDFRIDHCSFVDFCGHAIVVSNYLEPHGINRGVIDHNDFDNPYKDDPNVIGGGVGGRKVWGYGVGVSGTSYNWDDNLDNLLGKYDGLSNIAYIEDNVFSRTRHAIASNAGGYYVARHNTFMEPRAEHYQMVDVHGSSGPAPGVGGRGLEAYDNVFYGCEYKWMEPGPTYPWASIAFGLRGGGGVVFNNTIVDCRYGVFLTTDAVNPICIPKNVWIWNNQMVQQNAPTVGTAFIDNYGFQEGVDYFLYEKAGYAPYPYPHPLTLEATP